ncbi:MAG: hypothetical protein V3V82_00065 [Acidimicrobiia bacterium]
MPDLPSRQRHEDEMVVALMLIFSQWENRVTTGGVDWDRFGGEVSVAVEPPLREAHQHAAEQVAKIAGHTVPPGDVSREAAEWADRASREVGASMAATSRDRAAEAESQSLDAMSPAAAFTTLMAAQFARTRAVNVSMTEITRAVSAGETSFLVRFDLETSSTTKSFWITELDARVCPICSPLHNVSETVYGREFPSGPPAHPRCRCFLEHRAEPAFGPGDIVILA